MNLFSTIWYWWNWFSKKKKKKQQMVHDASIHVDSQRSFADAWTFVGRSGRCRVRVHFTPGPFSGLQWRCRRRSHAKSQSVNIYNTTSIHIRRRFRNSQKILYHSKRISFWLVWVIVITRCWRTITSEEEEWSGKSYYVLEPPKTTHTKNRSGSLVDDNLW